MSVSMDGGSSGHGQSQDFELNLASIIDCLTVLIAFLLASASFLSIGILEAGASAAGETAKSTTPPPVQITVEITQNHALTVKVSGKSISTTPIPARTEGWNYEAMTDTLSALKAKWPEVGAVTLTADNNIEYKDVVKTMEAIRKTMPAVLLGGF